VLVQRLALFGLDQRHKLAGDFEPGARSRHKALRHDRLDLGEGFPALLGRDEAQVDLALGPGRDGIDGLAAGHHADIERDAVRRIAHDRGGAP